MDCPGLASCTFILPLHSGPLPQQTPRARVGRSTDSLKGTLMKRRITLGLSALVLSLAAVASVSADAKGTTVCNMEYTLKGWSAFYKTSSGSGTITCENGQTAKVKISAKGGGLTAGEPGVREAPGKSSAVADIKELFGSYANASAAAGAVKSSEAQALTKGEVSLALAGEVAGVERGVTCGKFPIPRRGSPRPPRACTSGGPLFSEIPSRCPDW